MNLMNLHILFAPVQGVDDDAQVPSTAMMPLSLEEEVQYRCVGFIQAEIERYAEEAEELSPPPSEASDNSGTEREHSHDDDRPRRKGKQSKRSSQNGVLSRLTFTLFLVYN
jgi:cohesin complex subunit SA-1/2